MCLNVYIYVYICMCMNVFYKLPILDDNCWLFLLPHPLKHSRCHSRFPECILFLTEYRTFVTTFCSGLTNISVARFHRLHRGSHLHCADWHDGTHRHAAHRRGLPLRLHRLPTLQVSRSTSSHDIIYQQDSQQWRKSESLYVNLGEF